VRVSIWFGSAADCWNRVLLCRLGSAAVTADGFWATPHQGKWLAVSRIHEFALLLSTVIVRLRERQMLPALLRCTIWMTLLATTSSVHHFFARTVCARASISLPNSLTHFSANSSHRPSAR